MVKREKKREGFEASQDTFLYFSSTAKPLDNLCITYMRDKRKENASVLPASGLVIKVVMEHSRANQVQSLH